MVSIALLQPPVTSQWISIMIFQVGKRHCVWATPRPPPPQHRWWFRMNPCYTNTFCWMILRLPSITSRSSYMSNRFNGDYNFFRFECWWMFRGFAIKALANLSGAITIPDCSSDNNGWVGGWINGDGMMIGWMDDYGWKVGWMERRADGWTRTKLQLCCLWLYWLVVTLLFPFKCNCFPSCGITSYVLLNELDLIGITKTKCTLRQRMERRGPVERSQQLKEQLH